MDKILKWEKENKKIIFVFSLIAIFLLIFILNYNTIYVADDYAFHNSVWGNGQKFDFIHIFNRTLTFYLSWTGRFVSSFVNYTFLAVDKNIFNLINSLMFVTYIYLIYKIVKKEKETNPILLILIFLLVWLFIPQFGEVILWKIGAVIYLWTMTSVLAIVLLFINILKKKNKVKDGIMSVIFLTLFGVIAGNGFETNSLMLIAITTAIIIYSKFIIKQRIPIWAFTSYIGLIIGSFTNFLSPGNAVRIQTMGNNTSLFSRIIDGLGIFYYRGIVETKIFIIIPIIIIMYIIYLISKQKNIKLYLKSNVLVAFAFLSIFIIILTTSSILIGNHSLTEFLGWFYPNTKIFNMFFASLIFLIMLNIILCIIYRKKLFVNTSKEVNTIALFFTFSALLGICSYLVTPLAWPRSYMGMSTFLVIVVSYIVNNINFDFESKKNIYTIVTVLIIIFIVFVNLYTGAFLDMVESKRWSVKTEKYIHEQIKNNSSYIRIQTFMSKNRYNAASVEKWVIPAVVKDSDYVTIDGIHKDYEWINIAATNYYFKNNNAWSEGKRIIGYEE